MIKILDSFISDKIAAGEVIEQPLSIVKELIENSIDAKADSIVIEIKKGGKSYIRVTDNGSGIFSEELELAFARHATGKISDLSDLYAIQTLGFRGEALASIAAVTRLTVTTKTKEEKIGTRLIIHGGQPVKKIEIGCSAGTTFVIEDLFYNTPARKKFMKTDGAEASAIIDYVQKMSIKYANITFKLINNNKNVFITKGDGDVLDAIRTAYPSKEYQKLIAVKNNMVQGYISSPGVTRNNRKGQIFFVNGRIINSDVIDKGIKDGYKGRLFDGFPICILFVDVDPSKIDVNIHPNKRAVKFTDPDNVIRMVSSAIRDVLFSENAVKESEIDEYPMANDSFTDNKQEQVGIKEFLMHNATTTNNDFEYHPKDDIIKDKKDSFDNIVIEKPEYKPFDFNELKVVGYIFDTYIITETSEAMFMIDQHAAHERLLYEKLVNKYMNKLKRSQPVLTPVIIETSSDIYNYDRSWMEVLQKIGYDILDFGNNSFLIREIPEGMSLSEAKKFAEEFTENFEDNEEFNSIVVDKLIMKSCKGAVKANNHLSDMEVTDLISKLARCVNPFNCPHGRPTFIKVTKYEIEKAFRRK